MPSAARRRAPARGRRRAPLPARSHVDPPAPRRRSSRACAASSSATSPTATRRTQSVTAADVLRDARRGDGRALRRRLRHRPRRREPAGGARRARAPRRQARDPHRRSRGWREAPRRPARGRRGRRGLPHGPRDGPPPGPAWCSTAAPRRRRRVFDLASAHQGDEHHRALPRAVARGLALGRRPAPALPPRRAAADVRLWPTCSSTAPACRAFLPFFADAAEGPPRAARRGLLAPTCAPRPAPRSWAASPQRRARAARRAPRPSTATSASSSWATSLERVSGTPLDRLFAERVAGPLELDARLPPPLRRRCRCPAASRPPAPRARASPRPARRGCGTCPTRATARPGEVDDDNAWVMDGVAGHAGLFATARDVARFGQAVLDGRVGRPLSPPVPLRPRRRDPGQHPRPGLRHAVRRGRLVRRALRPRAARAPSATWASPAPACGSTSTASWWWRSSPTASHLGRAERHASAAFRPRFHDAVLDALEPAVRGAAMTHRTTTATSSTPSTRRPSAASTWSASPAPAWAASPACSRPPGYEVTGSDENVYPPMSDMLKAWGIQRAHALLAARTSTSPSPTWSSSATSSAG